MSARFVRIGEQTPGFHTAVDLLHEQAFPPDELTREDVRYLVLGQMSFGVVLDPGILVGAGVIEISQEDTGATLHAIAIQEYMRGRGLGSDLLRKLENTARNMGTQTMRLSYNTDQSREFFAKWGYEPDPDFGHTALAKTLT